MPALTAVLDFLSQKQVEMIVHAGDIVGYNAFPNEVIESFIDNGVLSIVGNHDRAVISGDVSCFNYEAARAVKWTAKKLNDDSINYLQNLKSRERVITDDKCIVIIHGSPSDYDEYVYEESATDDMLRNTGADILILGHTHVPYVKKFDIGVIMNPGSVGQPRDRNWRPSCIVLDTATNEAEIFRVDYHGVEYDQVQRSPKLYIHRFHTVFSSTKFIHELDTWGRLRHGQESSYGSRRHIAVRYAQT
jgi:putative phosphoesterase